MLLASYALRLLARGDGEALSHHMAAREAWGRAVDEGLGRAREHFQARCVAAEGHDRNDCDRSKARDRRSVARRIDAIRAEGEQLGPELCRAAPELAAALGAERCAVVASRYALSSSAYLGVPDLMGR